MCSFYIMISRSKAPDFSLVYKNCSRICNPHHLNEKENLCLMQNADKKQKKDRFPHPDDFFSKTIRSGKPVLIDQRCGTE